MKTHIDKPTIKKLIVQARTLGAFTKPEDGHKSIQCEVEKPDGKRVFVTIPLRLIDWLKDFDAPPAVEIRASKQTIRQLITPLYKAAHYVTTIIAGFIVSACVTDGKRTSRLSCAVKRSKTPFRASVFLRIDASGAVSCVERVAKLEKVECAFGKRFVRALLLEESHGGKWLLAKGKGQWAVLYQPLGMVGCAVAKSDIDARTQAEAIDAAMAILTDERKERTYRHQFEKACEFAEKAEREAREALGEEVGEIVRPAVPTLPPPRQWKL